MWLAVLFAEVLLSHNKWHPRCGRTEAQLTESEVARWALGVSSNQSISTRFEMVLLRTALDVIRMAPFFIFLSVLPFVCSTKQSVKANELGAEVLNTLGDDSVMDPFALWTRAEDEAKLHFQFPIASLNIDYLKNEIALKFRKNHESRFVKNFPEADSEGQTRLRNNFRRFERMPPTKDFMRFGKRTQSEDQSMAKGFQRNVYPEEPKERFERSGEVMRDSRGDNFMRLGRASRDFMRLGRSSSDFMRLGRAAMNNDFMRLGRSGENDFMRLGRSGENDFMRLGRTTGNVQRDVMAKNIMRFGRPDNFMRLGRNPTDATENSDNVMRFGRSDFLRSGMNIENRSEPRTAPESDSSVESNPMDKAISVLFAKQPDKEPEVDRSHPEHAANEDNTR